MTRFVVTTRRTRLTGLRAAWRLRTTFLGLHGVQDCALRTCAAAGTSAICIAPLPMIAPPQVQAQSLARAIRTDIGFSLFSRCRCVGATADTPMHLPLKPKGQSFMNAAIALTAFACPASGIGPQNQSK